MSGALELTIVFEPQPDGWIVASIPELPGVFSQGQTRDEARSMVLDAMREMLLAWAQSASTPAGIPAGADVEHVALTIAA